MRSEIVDLKEKDPFYPCPKCSKNALVQRDLDRYYCLWCGFKKDISEGESRGSGISFGLLLILLLLFAPVLQRVASLLQFPYVDPGYGDPGYIAPTLPQNSQDTFLQ